MALFNYRAVDGQGKTSEGILEAENREEAIRDLSERGLFVTFLEKQTEIMSTPSFFDRFRGVQTTDLAVFTNQLATMLSSGLPLSESLRDLADQVDKPKLKNAIRDIHAKVLSGSSLGDALANHVNIFPDLYVSMVRAGEAGSFLDESLRRLSVYFEQEVTLVQKVKSALTYPAVLIFVAVGIILFIITQFIPRFVVLFDRVGVALPLPTRILYQGSLLVKLYGLPCLALFILAAFSLSRFARTESGKPLWHRAKLSLPIFGKLYRKIAISRFLRTLGTLYAGGIPILEAIQIAERTMDNLVMEHTLGDVKRRVREGEPLAASLNHTKLFPSMVIRMVATGEKTGSLAVLLEKASDFYDMEINATVTQLSSLLQPMILVVVGGMIGFIMASTLLPIFQMIKLLRRP